MRELKVELVVAHYNERLDWIRQVNDRRIDKVYVYTKSRPHLACNKKAVINTLRLARSLLQIKSGVLHNKLIHQFVANVGREAHTYCYHSLTQYERLEAEGASRLVLFLQGHPHLRDVSELRKWIDEVEMTGSAYTSNYRIGAAHDYLINGKQGYWQGGVEDSGITIDEWASKFVRRNLRLEDIRIYWNACFGVLANKITSRAKSEYMEMCSFQLTTKNSEVAYYFERLWYYWFNLDMKNTA